ncbi:MAG: hypothetical protein AAF604_15815 [Acidobacteriota bacterium]
MPRTASNASPIGRLFGWLLASAALALPFLLVDFPPITDLPQQTAQIRLLSEALADPESPYRIQWLTPYSLSYGAIGLGWLLGGPLAAGRLGMLLIGLLWVGAVHLLAARRDRATAGAVLAAMLFFSHALYWGFFSFLIGWPAFVLWLMLTLEPPDPKPWKDLLRFLAAAILLYMGHALWLAAGGLWLALWSITRPRELLRNWPRFAAIAPIAMGAAVWFAGLRDTTFSTPALWVVPPWQRLGPDALRDAAFGGLKSPLEPLALAVLLLWLVVAVLSNRRQLAERTDRPLALAAGFFFGLYLLLPDKYTNTIFLDDRWLPLALVCALLALPAPRLPKLIRLPLAATLLVLFVAATSLLWTAIEHQELSGLAASLEALPDEPRVLGLDLGPPSRFLEGSPFIQTFAYAQVARGGELNFSFAEFAPSLVVYDPPRETPWTNGLEWFPAYVQPGDFAHFSHLLLSADDPGHATLGSKPEIAPITTEGRWRLYRTTPSEP